MDRGKGLELDEQLAAILNRRPAVGFAIGVVRAGSPAELRTHGMADIPSATPVTPDTVFRVASITKTFTAISVMQLWERGLVDLDAPVDAYLRAFRLVAGGPGQHPATLRHLLTHTSGVSEQHSALGLLKPELGESVAAGARVPTLAECYRGRLRLEAEPGTRFCYTDHGMAAAGQVVQDVTGQPLADYLREHVFEPLGMTSTELLRSRRLGPRLATGYRLGAHGPRPVRERQIIPAAAGSAYSTPADMARYLGALLSGGRNEHGQVLCPATLATMFEPQYQPHPRIPGMGLGFFRSDLGGHPAVEHQGVLPGYDAQILVAPDDGVGVLALTNGTRGGAFWLPTEVGRLARALIGAGDDGIRTDVPQRPDVWSEICGWYAVAGPAKEVRLRAMTGAGVEVFVRRGTLMLRVLSPLPALYRGLPLVPDDEGDPYLFRVDLSAFGIGTPVVAFGRDPASGGMALHLDVMPLTARRKPEVTNPRRWVQGAAGVATVVTLRRTLRGGTRG